MDNREIKAISKASRVEQITLIGGRIFMSDEGFETILHIVTSKSDGDVIKATKQKADELGLEIYRIDVIGRKSTSFNTCATWVKKGIYIDETRPLYFEGVFDGNGNKISNE